MKLWIFLKITFIVNLPMGEQCSLTQDKSGVFPTDILSSLFFALNIPPTGWKLDPELDGRKTNFSWLF